LGEQRAQLKSLATINLCTRFGLAHLGFESDIEEQHKTRGAWKGSPPFVTERDTRIGFEDIGLQRMTILNMNKARFLFGAIHGTELAAPRRLGAREPA